MASVRGRVLLGWLPRDEAVHFLRELCEFDPPLDDAAAEALWRPFRDRVEALPARTYNVLPTIGLTPVEAGHVRSFRAAPQAAQVIGVKKIDVRELVVRQYEVITERAEEYAKQLPADWLKVGMPLQMPNVSMPVRFGQCGPNGLSTYSEIDLPHAEFMFMFNAGKWEAVQAARHVTVMDGADRTYLWSGYHRTFAMALNTPMATVPAAVVAEVRNVLIPPSAIPTPGVNTGNAGVDDFCCFGCKAAKFGDFFVAGLFMDVPMKKKKYQLQVQANWVALDDQP